MKEFINIVEDKINEIIDKKKIGNIEKTSDEVIKDFKENLDEKSTKN